MAISIIPLVGQSLGQTRDNIRLNFQQIATSFPINHIDYGLAGTGKHKFLQMPEQLAAPATLANEGALFTSEGATSTVTELFFKREFGGDEIPMTECSPGADGWTYLPSGIMIQWGTAACSGGGSPHLFPRVFPNNCFLVVPGVNGHHPDNHFAQVNNVTAAGFTGWSSSRIGNPDNSTIYYIAIGN